MLQKCSSVEPDLQEVYLAEGEDGSLFGLILLNSAALQGWARQEEADISEGRTHNRIEFMKLFKDARVGVIDEMRVYQRGIGLGSKLLEDFVARAKSKGCAAVIVQAGVFEEQSEGFGLVEWYQRHEFETKGWSGELPLMVRWLAN